MTTTRICVTRGSPDKGESVDCYDVPWEPGLSLLDSLIWLREHKDPTLAVRYSCRANACKECSAVVDGSAGYLCLLKAEAGGHNRIEPLRNRTWLRDLVSELD